MITSEKHRGAVSGWNFVVHVLHVGMLLWSLTFWLIIFRFKLFQTVMANSHSGAENEHRSSEV